LGSAGGRCARDNRAPRVSGVPCAGCTGPPWLTAVGCHPVKSVLGASGDALRALQWASAGRGTALWALHRVPTSRGTALRVLERASAGRGGALRAHRRPDATTTTESPGLRGDHLDRAAAAGRAEPGGFPKGGRCALARGASPREASARPPLGAGCKGPRRPLAPGGLGAGPAPSIKGVKERDENDHVEEETWRRQHRRRSDERPLPARQQTSAASDTSSAPRQRSSAADEN
jgi:hypothetical protein